MSTAAPPSDLKRKVAIYRQKLLAPTNTFVLKQAKALTRWKPILVGESRSDDSLSLDGLELLFLRDHDKKISELSYRAYRLFNAAHPATVHALAGVQATLVHAHFGVDAVDIWPHIRHLRLPMLVTLHGYDINIHPDWWEAGHAGPRRRRYPRQLLALAKEPRVHFIAISEAIRLRALEYGIPEDRITVLYTGVDTDEFRPGRTPIASRTKRILYVGRLVENKGVDVLIRAVATIVHRVPGINLTIIGSGPLRAHLEELSSALKVPTQFFGTLDTDGVIKLLDESRVLCQPSITIDNGESEGLGMAILEAQACGVPVLTSARGGSTEGIIDGETGFRFPEWDADQLATLLTRVLEDDALIETLSRNAIRFVRKNFDLNACTAKLEGLYDDFIEIGRDIQ